MAEYHHLTTRSLLMLVVVALTVDSATSASLNKPNATEPTSNDFSSISVNASEVKQSANFAASRISSSNVTESMKPGDNNVTLIKIVTAATKGPSENVNGISMKMTLQLDGVDDEDDLLCEVLVFSSSDPLMGDDLVLTDYTCSSISNGSAEASADASSSMSASMPEPTPEPVAMPFSPIAVNGTKVKEIADFASSSVAYSRNIPNNMTEIEKAESQLYATGMNYKLTLKLKEDDGNDILCEVDVMDPTIKTMAMTRQLTQYNCLWNSTSSADAEEDDIPDDSILTKWFLE